MEKMYTKENIGGEKRTYMLCVDPKAEYRLRVVYSKFELCARSIGDGWKFYKIIRNELCVAIKTKATHHSLYMYVEAIDLNKAKQ